jgi:transposase
LIIRHFLMHEGICTSCGRIHKPVIPKGHRTGYGPRFSGLVALLSGDHGESRETVQRFCQQVLGLHLSTGTIQNIINRASKAILPHYRAIRDKAHQSPVNNVDDHALGVAGIKLGAVCIGFGSYAIPNWPILWSMPEGPKRPSKSS